MYALVTGASSGIGLEIAKLLAKKHYNLILAARRKKRLLYLKKQLESKYNISVKVIECDLSKEESCYQLCDEIKELDVTVLVNNAGFGKVGHFDTIPLEDEIDMIHTNIVAPHILTKWFVKEKDSGNILNVASMAGFQPGPVMAAYGATKAYLLNLSIAVNYELEKSNKNIHVTTLCPGPVDTEFSRTANVKFSLKGMQSRDVALYAIRCMFRKKLVIVPGLQMKLAHAGERFVPDKILLRIAYHFQKKKEG